MEEEPMNLFFFSSSKAKQVIILLCFQMLLTHITISNLFIIMI